jgi:hypothetical protein
VDPGIHLTTEAGYEVALGAETVGTVKAGGDVFSLTAPGVASVTLGATAETIRFVGMTEVDLTAGSAPVTVSADMGTNTWTAGAGALDITGGSGADECVYHAGDARLTVDDFAAAQGDNLTIDKGLRGAMQVGDDGQGGTLLTFGSGGGVDLKGIAASAVTPIHWS